MVPTKPMTVIGAAGIGTTHGNSADAIGNVGTLARDVGMDGGPETAQGPATRAMTSIPQLATMANACLSHGCRIARSVSVLGSVGTSSWLAPLQMVCVVATH